MEVDSPNQVADPKARPPSENVSEVSKNNQKVEGEKPDPAAGSAQHPHVVKKVNQQTGEVAQGNAHTHSAIISGHGKNDLKDIARLPSDHQAHVQSTDQLQSGIPPQTAETTVPSEVPSPSGSRTPDADRDVPAFLPLALLHYLRNVNTMPGWQVLIDRFLQFEKGYPNTGVCAHCISLSAAHHGQYISQKLPTKSRPSEVAAWIKRKVDKKHEPMEINVTKFQRELRGWWTGMQPSWRVLEGGQLSQDVPSEETWGSLGKGGSAGLYLVVVAVSWLLRKVAQDPKGMADVIPLVEDISWVLLQLCGQQKSHTKRAREEGSSAISSGKRCVELNLSSQS